MRRDVRCGVSPIYSNAPPRTPQLFFEIRAAREFVLQVCRVHRCTSWMGCEAWRIGVCWRCIGSGVCKRVMTICFNGASDISQKGRLACLDKEGMREIDRLILYQLESAWTLRCTKVELGFGEYGGRYEHHDAEFNSPDSAVTANTTTLSRNTTTHRCTVYQSCTGWRNINLRAICKQNFNRQRRLMCQAALAA